MRYDSPAALKQAERNDEAMHHAMEYPPGISSSLIDILCSSIMRRQEMFETFNKGLPGEVFSLRAIVGETVRVLKTLELPQEVLDQEQRRSYSNRNTDDPQQLYLRGFWDGVGWIYNLVKNIEHSLSSEIPRDHFVTARKRILRTLEAAMRKKGWRR